MVTVEPRGHLGPKSWEIWRASWATDLRIHEIRHPRPTHFYPTLTLQWIVGTKIVGKFEEHRGFKFNQIYKLVNLNPRSTHFYPTLKPRGHYRNPTIWKTLHKQDTSRLCVPLAILKKEQACFLLFGSFLASLTTIMWDDGR